MLQLELMRESDREQFIKKCLMISYESSNNRNFFKFSGEGLFIGQRQIFVRFAGCNLNCNYCDTNDSKSEKSGKLMTVDEVLAAIEKVRTPDCHVISFTGGEPSLYPEFINEVARQTDLKILFRNKRHFT